MRFSVAEDHLQIDLPNADAPSVTGEVSSLLQCDESILPISAKSGKGVNEVLEAIVRHIPQPPSTHTDGKLRALAFDSWFDEFRGVVNLVYIASGTLKKGKTQLHRCYDVLIINCQVTKYRLWLLASHTKSPTSEYFIRPRSRCRTAWLPVRWDM